MPTRFLRDPEIKQRLYRLARQVRASAPDDPERRADHRRLLLAHAVARVAGVESRTPVAALETAADLGYWPAHDVMARLGREDLDRAAREVGARLGADDMAPCWRDVTSVGWLHQAFTDIDREALDRRIQRGHRLDATELAAKTQVFSEPWMAAWLVQNTLGPVWLAWCQRAGLVPAAIADGTLEALAARRRGEHVRVDGDEARWLFYVPRSREALASVDVPEALEDLQVLDPACGAGHLLVPALDHLVAMRLEAAALQGRPTTRAEVVERTLAENLRGFDLDDEVAALARALVGVHAGRLAGPSPSAPPPPPRTSCSGRSARSSGRPDSLVGPVWGRTCVGQPPSNLPPRQGGMSAKRTGGAVTGGAAIVGPGRDPELSRLGALASAEARARLGDVLADGSKHVVLANPPWLSSRKTTLPGVEAAFPTAKVDLYACFMEQALTIATPGGQLGFVTQHGWMFLRRFERFRRELLERAGVAALAHLGRGGGFEDWADLDKVMQAAMVVLRKGRPLSQPTPCYRLDALGNRDKAHALAERPPTHHRALTELRAIEEWPLVYWWSDDELARFVSAPPLGRVAPVKQGIATADNQRFVRHAWEVPADAILLQRVGDVPSEQARREATWVPYIKGAAGKRWLEPVDHVLYWKDDGAALRAAPRAVLRNEPWWFRAGVAFTYIGSAFGARLHRFCSVFDVAGSSVFHERPAEIACVMNSQAGRQVLESLNPTVNFQVGDVERLPTWPEPEADAIYAVLEDAFAEHERGREPSVEFVRPGPSRWLAAQDWAQRAVDRPRGAPLPPWTPGEAVAPAPGARLSFALGVALGRFHPGGRRTSAQPGDALPGGALVLGDGSRPDGLDSRAAAALLEVWREVAASLDATPDRVGLRAFLRERFFVEIHLPMYARCPVVLPLSTGGPLFALVGVHAIGEATWAHLRSEAARLGDAAFVGQLEACLRDGPDGREVDAPLAWVDTDGIELNSAALWPVVDARSWPRPAAVWRKLATAPGRRAAATWSAVSRRYWPSRPR